VATTLAQVTGGELIRLQCYEGLDASTALYEWDYLETSGACGGSIRVRGLTLQPADALRRFA
jgi:MoxR-like ATPase